MRLAIHMDGKYITEIHVRDDVHDADIHDIVLDILEEKRITEESIERIEIIRNKMVNIVLL